MLQCYIQTPVGFYLISSFVLLVLILYLARFGGRSSVISWFRIFLFSSLSFNIITAWLKCTPSQSQFSLAVDAYGLLSASIIPLLIIFILHLTNKEQLLTKTWVRLGLFSFTMFALYLFWRSDFAIVRDLSSATYSFGFRNYAFGPGSNVIGLIDLIGYILPFAIVVSYYRHLQDPLKKREARFIIWAIVIMVVPSVLSEAVIPVVLHTGAFPISFATSVIASSLITYAITKYGVHAFNVSNIGNNLMQVMPGGLVVLDHTNTIQYANTGAAAMLGHSTSDLAGTSIKKLFVSTAKYEQFHTRVLGQTSANRTVAGQESQLLTKSGQALSVSLNVVSVYAGTELVNYLVSFTDITPLKQAEAQLEAEKANVEHKVVERTHELAAAQAQLSASINSLPLGYIMFNAVGDVVALNPSTRRILHVTGSKMPTVDVLAKKLGDYDLEPLLQGCLARRRSTEVKELSVGPRYLHLYASPIIGENNHIIGAVMLVEDITEQKVMERSKDEFFSIASHELRTPLTSIRGNSSMMINYYQEALHNPDLQEMVHDVHESSIRLIGIVNDFLDMSRLEQGKMTFKFTEAKLGPVIESVVTELQNEAKAKKTKLIINKTQLDALPSAIADTDRIKQVVFNLVGNALKFTEGGKITLDAKANADLITVAVTDTGRGMPPAAQALLFHKFQQGGASLLTRDTVKGTGLGLYISRLMVEGMGGKIWLEKSEEGKGSTFIFTIPVATPIRLGQLAKALLAAQATTDSTTGITTQVPTQKA